MHILLIDDEPTVLSALTLLLKALSMEVSAFSSSLEALDHLSRNLTSIDFVLTDLRMPAPNGYEVVEIITKTYPLLAVAVMSAHATSEDQAALIALGAVGILNKPFHPAEIHRIIEAGRRARKAA